MPTETFRTLAPSESPKLAPPESPKLAQLEYLEISGDLKDRIGKLAKGVSTEFHNDLFQLLRQFRPDDLARFTELWSRVDPGMRSTFVAFIIMGDDPDGKFLSYLDGNAECQQAVDMAFAAHIDSLRDLGRSLSEAEHAVSASKSEEIATILLSTEQAEKALESVEDAIEGTDDKPLVHDKLQEARTAVEDARRGLRALAGIEE